LEKDKKWFFIVYFLISAAIYLLHFFYTLDFSYNNLVSGTDTYFYFMLAGKIASGKISLPFTCIPGYPLFLAVFARLWHWFPLFIFLQHVLLWLSGILLFLSVKTLSSERSAFLSGMLYLFYTPFIMHASVLAPEGLGLFLFGMLLYGFSRRMDRGLLLSNSVIYGLIGGFAIITRPVLSAWVFSAPVYVFLTRKSFKKFWFVFVFWLICIIPVFVVMSMNYRTTGKWFLSAHTGINLYIANNEKANGLFNGVGVFRTSQEGLLTDSVMVASRRCRRSLSIEDANTYWKDEAVNFIYHNPVKFAKLLLLKSWFILSSKEFYEAQGLMPLPGIPFGIIAALAVIGLWITRGDAGVGILRQAFVLVFISSLLGFINVRYKLMFAYPSIGLAAISLREIIIVLRRKRLHGLTYLFLFLTLSVLSFLKPAVFVDVNSTGQYNKAISCIEAGEPEKAKQILLKMLSRNPKNWAAWFALGQAYYILQDFGAAKNAYKTAMALNTNFFDAEYNLALCYNKLGQNEKARALIKKMLVVAENEPDVLFLSIKVYTALGECKNAAFYKQRLISLNNAFQELAQDAMKGCQNERTELDK